MRHLTPRTPGRRLRGDDGTALVEFTFVAVLLLVLVFGIIQFGLVLSFKQDMTRAAAEGARGGAVALPASNAAADARTRTEEAVRAFGQDRFSTNGCIAIGLTCNVAVVDCGATTLTPGAEHCVTVELIYDYKANPLFGRVPLIQAFLPETIRAESVAKTNA